MSLLLKNCRLIPELSGGWDQGLADVLLEGQMIAKILPAGDFGADSAEGKPAADTVIDCGGRTLMPGLIDLHVHLCTAGCGIGVEYVNEQDLIHKACRSAQSYLAWGYTTIRDMGTTNAASATVRNMINEGILKGPRILSSTRMLLPAGLLERSDENTSYHSISGLEEMRRAVREEIGESRADVVKIYASGSAYNPGGEPTLAILTPEEIRAAVEMADFRARKVAAHCHSNTAIHYCIDAGVYTIEHASYIDEAGIAKMQGKDAYLVPTMTPYSYVKGSNPDPMMDAWFAQIRQEMGEKIAPHMKAAYDAGLELGFGTDTADGDFRTNGPGAEFRVRTEQCGMRTIDVLKQATQISAKIIGLEDRTGTLREGFLADLILVDGKPEEDVSVFTRKPDLVIRNGEITCQH
ncbi:MAG: amidohydrolase family protein [Mogibacterium sp.]|nr:amidohydrolase family protein [Mogibacterium sp.]